VAATLNRLGPELVTALSNYAHATDTICHLMDLTETQRDVLVSMNVARHRDGVTVPWSGFYDLIKAADAFNKAARPPTELSLITNCPRSANYAA
jgi:hypothetical protein